MNGTIPSGQVGRPSVFRRAFPFALLLGVVLGVSLNLVWITYGEDVIELCHISEGGQGFSVPALGTDVRCAAKPGKFLFAVTYYSILSVPIFLPMSMAIVWLYGRLRHGRA